MSGTPSKRLHEEVAAGGGTGGGGGVGQNSGCSKYLHDDSGAANPSVGPKVAPPPASSSAANEYHHHAQPFDHMGQQDSRMPSKIARSEPTTDRWSPLLPMYHHRLSSASNDLHSDHPVFAENRPESRNSKDNVRDHKVENRETGELLLQSGKESRGDDNKEVKFDRDRDRGAYHPDYKGENSKLEKEGYGVNTSHLNWKESKQHHRGKRYPDTPGGNADSWHASRSNLHGPHEREVAKEGSVTEERDYIEPHEAVGENEADLKDEDRFKDKDRKRKESKHRDWGERDKDRNERRNNLQLGNSSGEGKEPVREEREAERWDRERKDLSKDKEKLKRGKRIMLRRKRGMELRKMVCIMRRNR